MATAQQVRPRTIQVPFQIGSRGEVAYVTNPGAMAAQEIKAAVLTYEGERLMRPDVGSPFSTAIFGPIPGDDIDYLSNSLQTALARQCRMSVVNDVTFDMSTVGQLAVSINYTPIAFVGTMTVVVPLFTTTTT